MVLYNANLDRSQNNRKVISELKKDLKRWEEERPKKKKAVVSDIVGYQVHMTVLLRLISLTSFIIDNSQNGVLPTSQRRQADEREDDTSIYR